MRRALRYLPWPRATELAPWPLPPPVTPATDAPFPPPLAAPALAQAFPPAVEPWPELDDGPRSEWPSATVVDPAALVTTGPVDL